MVVKLCKNKQTGVVFLCDGFIEKLPYMEVIESGEEGSGKGKKEFKVKSESVEKKDEEGKG